MLLMSGEGSPLSDADAIATPAAGDTFGDWRDTMMRTAAKSPASDTPAMIQGARSDRVSVLSAAALPQEEQKRDPGESGAPQLGHCRAVPQLEQNLPEVGSPHPGHAGGVAVMGPVRSILKDLLELPT
jgi:hypothetical protein